MASYVAASSHVKLRVCRNSISNGCLLPNISYARAQRKCSYRSSRVALLSSWNSCKFSAFSVKILKVNPCSDNGSLRHYCMGTLVNTDGTPAFEWVPIVDQALLVASIFLTSLAGVVPGKKLLSRSQNGLLNDCPRPEESAVSGSATENVKEVNLKLPWEMMEKKLMDASKASELGGNSESRFIKFERDQAKRPLSLYAIAEGPRFRLLWASFQWLKKEVDSLSGMSITVSSNGWSTVFFNVIQNSCQPIYMAWLEKELCLKSIKSDKEILSLMVEKLMGDTTIMQNIRSSGKEDLYAELAQFLTFGSLREDSCYNCSLFTQHGIAILEDFIITLADGIASVYLELISVDSNISNEISRVGLTMCTLSTRELQKLRNEVALNQWLHRNMEAVISMYEDRLDLCMIQRQIVEVPSENKTEKFSWWKKLTLRESRSESSPLYSVVIGWISITVKRTKELRALAGWRYYFSLFLELADITMPLVRTIFAKVSDAISFFLVCLIGRSLGLIYSGIRQSLQWK
ncbi:uncharacterized protein LOC127786866 isoform X2 [Diospyros lotus]|uniref:uncharacterized protein LOC127786866 isoform X2 n=1 Tax=Diospyros lotus TaxID=55363 RepID=UPI002254C206|nr:uncharacterized protein LOC127786866 isoform X2 [Diospyros lotus]